MMQAVILAGGLGTRLHPITHTIPKSLVEIAGEPFISHQLRLLKKQGVEDVVICTGYLNYMIMDFVRYGQKWGLYITYSHDGGELLGTGGAIKKALPFLENNFFVLYGDSYLDYDLSVIEQAYIDKWDKSNIVYNNGIIERFDTGDNVEYIDWGLGVLSKEVFTKYPHKQLSLSTVYNDLLNINQLAAFEVNNRFYEIGSMCGILDTEQYIGRK
jgi:MurNAc alpha-1-phosphate uridylyltransferase